ncbi:DinB family protein [Streptomyces lincolnensis]|uniref:DinB family protein n=1 Tax=Streptomyces TaxID=1883 RepID=UPI001E2F7BA9|nr:MULTISPECIES: DinB family protein [Streptomyces]MCD7440098.1 DinB family protein [Streptomyces lincolnensis]WLW53778.1 DinB family protein [Streptomyces coralus]
MTVSRSDLLRRQFDLTWALFEYHLDRLEPEDFLWEPAPHCWTVRRTADDTWVPDWADTEPDPVPVPTIAWLSWHIGWWWSVTLDHTTGRPPRERTDVTWPGPGKPTIEWLRGLRTDWLTALADLTESDLDTTARFPLPDDPSYTVADMLAWVNAELMKNAAEIGQMRMLRAARSAPTPE